MTPDRAFVVHLRRSSGSDDAALSGRIEHVISGRSARFDTLAELAAFMSEVTRGRVFDDPQ